MFDALVVVCFAHDISVMKIDACVSLEGWIMLRVLHLGLVVLALQTDKRIKDKLYVLNRCV